MRACFVSLTVALSLSPAVAAADEDAIPADIQAVVIKKILGFDPAFGGSKGSIAVLWSGSGQSEAEGIARVFTSTGIKASALSVEAATAKLPADVGAVYVLPSISTSTLKELSTKSQVLTVSGFARMAEAGDVSVALARIEGGKIEIVVNLARAKSEGHSLSSNLLRLARVIR
jgi:hypothetical protein